MVWYGLISIFYGSIQKKIYEKIYTKKISDQKKKKSSNQKQNFNQKIYFI